MKHTLKLTVLAAAVHTPLAAAQTPAPHHSRAWSANVVVPQSRVLHVGTGDPRVTITAVSADIVVVDGIARTALLVDVDNRGALPTEAELLLPLPEGATVTGFDFLGTALAPSTELMAKSDAVATYESIVAELRDPALLEFVGTGLLRSSVFPVPAGGTQRVRVQFEEVLAGVDGRWDYELPRSESLAVDVPWTVDVEIRSRAGLADAWSPSHDLEVIRRDEHGMRLRSRGPLGAGALRLSVLLSDGPVATALFTSANPDGPGGWFLLLAGAGLAPDAADVPPREVTIVLDRSGSMGGGKLEQALDAARQVIEGLDDGEAFQIIDYASDVGAFSHGPVVKTRANIGSVREYLDGLRATGGTDIDGALQRALSTPPIDGFLPVVLFLTDGLPTEGETREHVIRERAEAANAHGRRIFTFGVGADVNAPLLDAVAVRSRGRATYVRPGEDVEVAIGGVFEDLSGPVLTDLAFEATNEDGEPLARLVRDVYPDLLPDLYRDDRLLLLGRYTTPERATLRLTGTRGDRTWTRSVAVDFARAKVRNSFVPRLWAMRRIAALEDSLRQKGADPNALASLQHDPRFSEIVREMLRLSTEFGVLTDTTAFLALEGTALGDEDAIVVAANEVNFKNNVVRSGDVALTCQETIHSNRAQGWAGAECTVADERGRRVAADTIQTRQGRTYFRRGGRWIDGRLALRSEAVDEPDRVVVTGSPEYVALVAALSAEGRAGQLALEGEILVERQGETILVRPADSALDGE